MAYDIGGMLARSGQTVGQAIGGGFADLGTGIGTGIGGMLTRRREKQAEQNAQQQFQQILEENKNNPDAMRVKGQKLMTSNDPNMQRIGKMVVDEAIRLTALQTTKEEKGTAQGIQGGLSAITQAAARGTPLEQLQEATRSVVNLGGTQDQIISAYKSGVDLAKAGKPEGFTMTPGSIRYEPDPTSPTGFRQVAEAPFKEEEEKPVDKSFELAKTGKYTAQSIQDATQADGSIDYAKLQEVVKSEGRGNVGANAEKRNNEISAESTKASIGLARNRQLQQELLASPNKTSGILSDLRTSVLDIAGLRDAEEEAKTAFLRTRNTDIINSLPPGVASDTDVRIFSQGFPAANAPADEILRYLQAEERILAASSDMALVADRHLASQINAGLDATMVGFEDKKQRYASIMQQARKDIEEKTANAQTEQEAIEIEREIIRQVSEVLGFVPKFYR
jgi:hypothetical protein